MPAGRCPSSCLSSTAEILSASGCITPHPHTEEVMLCRHHFWAWKLPTRCARDACIARPTTPARTSCESLIPAQSHPQKLQFSRNQLGYVIQRGHPWQMLQR